MFYVFTSRIIFEEWIKLIKEVIHCIQNWISLVAFVHVKLTGNTTESSRTGGWGEHLNKSGENCLMRGFTVCTLCHILFGWYNQGWNGWGMYIQVSQEECARLQESVPYVKVYRYNPKHLCPKLNGYGDNGQGSLKLWQLLHIYWLPNTY